MLRKALYFLELAALVLTIPASTLAARPAGWSAQAVVYLPIIARPAPPRAIDMTFQFSATLQPQGDTRQLAVAFHSVQYIDARARTLGELTFGTPEANALQGEGWFGNETDPEVGTLQWAGGPAKRATMRLAIPQGTEGLLLHITPIQNATWMTVTVDSQVTATLRVDGFLPSGDPYWHDGYVPVTAPVPEPSGSDGPQWTQGRYFPRFPTTDRVYAIRTRHRLNTQYASSQYYRVDLVHDAMMALTLAGMQGTINRSSPSVYIDWWPNPCDGYFSTHLWIPYMERLADVTYLDLDGLSAFHFLYRRYGSRFNGAVVYNPEVPDTINLATMIAGLEDRIILAPSQLEMSGMPQFDSVVDLRPLAAQEGWDATEEGKYRLYQWVYDNLWPRLEHRIVGVISPGPPTSRAVPPENAHFLPLAVAARDYIVALRLSALWLSPSEEPQASLFARFLEDAPSPIPVMGFFALDEPGTVAMASRHGDWVPVITNGNSPVQGGDLTLFSGLRPEVIPYQAEMDSDRILATLGDAPVAMLYTSDGDNIGYCIDRGFGNCPWEKVQGHRFGWSINPILVDVAPLIWNYYLESASQVSLIGGVSGAGYTDPGLMSDTQLTNYLTYAARYLNDTGLRTFIVSLWERPWDQRLAAAYYNGLRNTGYVGAQVGGRDQGLWGLGFRYVGVPTPAVSFSYDASVNDVDWIVRDILSKRPGELFMDLAIYPWKEGQVVQDNDAHGGQALFFSRNMTIGCVQGPFAELAAGSYTATFRLKIADDQGSEPIARVYVSETTGPQQVYAQRYVAPSDFQAAGRYQDLILSFTLDHLTQDIELGITFFGGTAPPEEGNWSSGDLYADEILVAREGGLDLPVFVCIAEITTWPAQPENVRVVDELQRAGVVVLHPDEFMAALNPEFMIEFARPRLGAGHPALVEAQRLLDQERFLESLLAVREGLKGLQQRGAVPTQRLGTIEE
jgi:hypothetical protein